MLFTYMEIVWTQDEFLASQNWPGGGGTDYPSTHPTLSRGTLKVAVIDAGTPEQ